MTIGPCVLLIALGGTTLSGKGRHVNFGSPKTEQNSSHFLILHWSLIIIGVNTTKQDVLDVLFCAWLGLYFWLHIWDQLHCETGSCVKFMHVCKSVYRVLTRKLVFLLEKTRMDGWMLRFLDHVTVSALSICCRFLLRNGGKWLYSANFLSTCYKCVKLIKHCHS